KEARFHTTLEFPNSKSWFRLAGEVEDPLHLVQAMVLDAPYQLEKLPARFDFGCGSWVYGQLRPGQSVLLSQGRRAAWQMLLLGPGGGGYAAAAPGQPRAEGWGHLIEGAPGGRAVAF